VFRCAVLWASCMSLGGGKRWVGCWFDWLDCFCLCWLALLGLATTSTPPRFSTHPFPISHFPICVCVCVMTYAVRKPTCQCETAVKQAVDKRWRIWQTHRAEGSGSQPEVGGQRSRWGGWRGWKGSCHLIARLQLVATNEARLITLIGCSCPVLKCHWNWNCNCANAHSKKKPVKWEYKIKDITISNPATQKIYFNKQEY